MQDGGLYSLEIALPLLDWAGMYMYTYLEYRSKAQWQ